MCNIYPAIRLENFSLQTNNLDQLLTSEMAEHGAKKIFRKLLSYSFLLWNSFAALVKFFIILFFKIQVGIRGRVSKETSLLSAMYMISSLSKF